MLGIDYQHGRFRGDEPGADSDDLSRKPGSAVQRAEARGNLWLGGVDPGSAPVRQLGQGRQRAAPAIRGADDRTEPSTDDTAHRQLPGYGPGESSDLSARQVRNTIHNGRPRLTGLRGQGTRKSKWAGNQADTGTRIRGLRPDSLPAGISDFGGATVSTAELSGVPAAEHDVSTNAAGGSSHRRTAQASAERFAWILAHRHGASRRSGWAQGCLSHQRSG